LKSAYTYEGKDQRDPASICNHRFTLSLHDSASFLAKALKKFPLEKSTRQTNLRKCLHQR